jgi:hypothetical protein
MFQTNLFNSSKIIIQSDKHCSCGCCEAYFTETPNLIHHGKLECGECGKFIKWQPKPKNLEIAQNFAQYFDGNIIKVETINE